MIFNKFGNLLRNERTAQSSNNSQNYLKATPLEWARIQIWQIVVRLKKTQLKYRASIRLNTKTIFCITPFECICTNGECRSIRLYSPPNRFCCMKSVFEIKRLGTALEEYIKKMSIFMVNYYLNGSNNVVKGNPKKGQSSYTPNIWVEKKISWYSEKKGKK